jgi:hypothetical protein
VAARHGGENFLEIMLAIEPEGVEPALAFEPGAFLHPGWIVVNLQHV